MPTGKLDCRLINKIDHFAVTVIKKDREKYSLTYDSILFLEVFGKTFFRAFNKDFQISIPKRFFDKPVERVLINIIGVYSKSLATKRCLKKYVKDCINVEAFIPKKTIFGKNILVFDLGNWEYVWYVSAGGVEPIKIKKKINAERIAELVGFFFGDGNTSKFVRSFRLNNCEASTLVYCVDILNELGIQRNLLKVQIIYNSHNKIGMNVRRRCIDYWSKVLMVKKSQIVSVNWNKGKSESLKYGSARIFFDSAIFVEILLHGILKDFIKILKNPQNKIELSILEGFVRGLAAAEGCVYLRDGVLSKVSMSFNQNSRDLEFYKKIFTNLGITYGKHKQNELYIYGAKNFSILDKIDIFKMHKKRKQKFLTGYSNHKFLK
jgi:hypothetical protein